MAAISLGSKNLSRSLLAGNSGFATAYEHVQSITVGSLGASSVSFTEIPQNYRHLQIRGVVRSTATGAAGAEEVFIRFNGDSSASYSYHLLQGNGSTTVSTNTLSQTYGNIGMACRDGYAAGVYSGLVSDILDYSNTTKNKTTRTLRGQDTNGAGFISIMSSGWYKTEPITTITIIPESVLFKQHSTFSLYGVK